MYHRHFTSIHVDLFILFNHCIGFILLCIIIFFSFLSFGYYGVSDILLLATIYWHYLCPHVLYFLRKQKALLEMILLAENLLLFTKISPFLSQMWINIEFYKTYYLHIMTMLTLSCSISSFYDFVVRDKTFWRKT